jgi:hypothetical protein
MPPEVKPMVTTDVAKLSATTMASLVAKLRPRFFFLRFFGGLFFFDATGGGVGSSGSLRRGSAGAGFGRGGFFWEGDF